MNMKRCIVLSILLMLSLESGLLVAGHPSVADDVGTILLASQGKGVADHTRPWTCCDRPKCFSLSSSRLICNCEDEVERCAPTCGSCRPSKWDSSLKVCQDTYVGEGPGPACAERPWTCCDNAICTGTYPPRCSCADEVEQCAATCKSCEPALLNPSRHACEDSYDGFPGPRCTYAVAAAGN